MSPPSKSVPIPIHRYLPPLYCGPPNVRSCLQVGVAHAVHDGEREEVPVRPAAAARLPEV
ncbi:hypothetical protein ANCDUO_08659 [Ancylostoma duodenale]|uniref:Uncharacterized protein n=1 Tax=Ancylostoma duodenale TaxID=51022 RepID=A0A0C2CVY7_9BILA|nr:hypothetical protein ANCDUO_08659 [Ancylostoma duodenale]